MSRIVPVTRLAGRFTRSADAYARAEGFWGLEQWEQANEQFRLATQPENSKPLYKVRWGMLLHERFNDGEAADLFREALAKDPSNATAYVGLAAVSAESFNGKAAGDAMKAARASKTGAYIPPHPDRAKLRWIRV